MSLEQETIVGWLDRYCPKLIILGSLAGTHHDERPSEQKGLLCALLFDCLPLHLDFGYYRSSFVHSVQWATMLRCTRRLNIEVE